MAGDGLVLVSLLLSATVTVAQGRLLTGRDPVAVTAVQFLGATAGRAAGGGPHRGRARGCAGWAPGRCWPWPRWRWAGRWRRSPCSRSARAGCRPRWPGAFLNLEPLVGAIAGAVAFGDPVGLVQVAGGLAILGGIGLSSLPLIAGAGGPRRGGVAAGAGPAWRPAGRVPRRRLCATGAGCGRRRAALTAAAEHGQRVRQRRRSGERTAGEVRVLRSGSRRHSIGAGDRGPAARRAGERPGRAAGAGGARRWHGRRGRAA